MAMIDAHGRSLPGTRPPAHQPLPSGDLRQAELAFPFDMAWVGGGNAYRVEALARIMPIPTAEYGQWGADWHLVHLSNLLGPVVALDDVAAYYRVHGANAFEPAGQQLDLARVRREIVYQRATAAQLLALADELGLHHPERLLSLSNIALRIISTRLAPRQHPVAGDRAAMLLADAIRAAFRRSDVSIPMRTLLVAGLAAIAVAPRPVSERLAELFMFPDRRRGLNPVLERMQRANGRGGAP
jgi:hypothetical protein